ncbi:MAG: FHA domain-containing protein [Deltaproteobacteria bacterium]|nr:MAG: FHA domain-containing protein [Deltaproteobacteria bacterium]
MPDRYLLRIAHHPDPDRIGRVRFLYPGERIELGRNCTVFGPDGLQDPRMSRAHARIVALSYGVIVEDLGSRNGTVVNGVPVRRTDVDPGDLIGMGRVIIQVGARPGDRIEPPRHPAGIVSASPAMWPVIEQVTDPVHTTGVTIVWGPRGSGRRTIARALHDELGREGAFVTASLVGVPPDRVPYALHGHATDADRSPMARADGGTLVLTDMDAADPAAWESVVALVETGAQHPVGGRPQLRDIKLVITMARDPSQALATNDLPTVIWSSARDRTIFVPPLHARREDILPLARHLACLHRGWPVRLDRHLAMALGSSGWPGEVDELDSVIARIVDEQRDRELLTLPDWAHDVLGPRAPSSQSTFDSLELLPLNPRRP